MCCGSAARRRFGAADHALAQVNLFFYWGGGGGGVVRLTAKPRYLLLLHRGNEKSNTVTALIVCNIKGKKQFVTYCQKVIFGFKS